VSDHFVDEEIVRYRNKLTPAQELLRMDDHARECASCRTRLADSYGIEPALLPGRIDPTSDTGHLAYEQMEAYTDNTLPPVQMDEVRRHVSVCQTCAQELLDLENFSQQMQHPAAAPAGRPRLWQRRAPLLRQAAAVTVLGLTGLLIYMWQTSGRPSRMKAGTTEDVSPVSIAELQLAADIAALPAPARLAVAKAIESRKINLPAEVAELRGQAQILRGSSDSGARFAVLAPVGEVVSEARPNFRWQPLQGTVSYSVAIFDEGLNAVQSSSLLYTTQWQPAQPLQRGHIYQWQVTATMKDGTTVISPRPPSVEARLLILSQPKADELERFRQAHADSHLVLGLLYAQSGMVTDAQTELAKVSSDDPRHDTAQALLDSIRHAPPYR